MEEIELENLQNKNLRYEFYKKFANGTNLKKFQNEEAIDQMKNLAGYGFESGQQNSKKTKNKV